MPHGSPALPERNEGSSSFDLLVGLLFSRKAYRSVVVILHQANGCRLFTGFDDREASLLADFSVDPGAAVDVHFFFVLAFLKAIDDGNVRMPENYHVYSRVQVEILRDGLVV